MKRIIHHIRNQPEEIRRHILHVMTAVFAVVLLMFWIYSLGTNLNNPDIGIKMSNDLKPLSVLKSNLIGGYNSIYGSE